MLLVLQLGYAGQYLNLTMKASALGAYEVDYTGGFDLSDSFFLGVNAAYFDASDDNDSSFAGAALIPTD